MGGWRREPEQTHGQRCITAEVSAKQCLLPHFKPSIKFFLKNDLHIILLKGSILLDVQLNKLTLNKIAIRYCFLCVYNHVSYKHTHTQ